MAIQFIIIKGTEGYDVSNMFEEITWSGRKGAAPRSVKITLIDDDGRSNSRLSVDCENGDQCVFYENGEERFRGIIVKHQQSSSKKLIITAYDNMYYLANNKDSFCYSNQTATQIFNDCMTRIGMTGGEAADTGYIIPELPKAKTTYYDVLLDALSTTYKATGIRYYISSDKGNIHLRRRMENAMQWVLESGSEQANITSYDYTKSIDKIRTRVRLLSKEDAVVYEQANSALEAKIGTFMEIKSVDDSYTAAQMQELVESIFSEKGSPSRSLKVSGAGISDAISGNAVYVIIPHLGMNQTFYIDEDTHKFTRESHTMTLKLNYADDAEYSHSGSSSGGKTSSGGSGGGKYKVGSKVAFKGGSYYVTSNSSTPATTSCPAGAAKITSIAEGAKHPYHLDTADKATWVHGWVDASSFS